MVEVVAAQETEPLSAEPAPDIAALDELADSAPPVVASAVVTEVSDEVLSEVLSSTIVPMEAEPDEVTLSIVPVTERLYAMAAPVETEWLPSVHATAAPGRVMQPAPMREPRTPHGKRSSPRANQPPVFSAPSYAFEIPSRRAGGGEVAPLGAVLARDPDRGPVTYSLTAGDWTRFKVGAASGAITYLGPDLPGTRRYELRVTARDRGRLMETATVVVTVATREAAVLRNATVHAAAAAPRAAGARAVTGEPRSAEALPASVARSIAAARATAAARAVSARRPVSAAPRRAAVRAAAPGPRTALSDAARTYTGVPVLIDVLANDGDLDGLRIVAVTAPAHGTTAVAEGVVRYAPAPGHRGRDTFTYTLVDEDGRTARATVSVMVVG